MPAEESGTARHRDRRFARMRSRPVRAGAAERTAGMAAGYTAGHGKPGQNLFCPGLFCACRIPTESGIAIHRTRGFGKDLQIRAGVGKQGSDRRSENG